MAYQNVLDSKRLGTKGLKTEFFISRDKRCQISPGPKPVTTNGSLKVYYKMMTSQNVSFEAQVMNFFIS